MKTVVSMNAQGRLTVPAVAREVLQINGPTEFELEVTAHEMILRPAIIIPREDAWAYRAEHLSRIETARGDVREGRTRLLSENELEQLAEPPS